MKVFITDGTPQTFFTAVFDAFNKECIILSDTQYQLSLDSEVVNVSGDLQKCKRVVNSIQRYDSKAIDEILLALRSCDTNKEQSAFEYIKQIIKYNAPVRKRLSIPEVIRFNEIIYKVRGETHRLKGFLRFMECCNGAFYAPYSPDNNITDLLMPHFAERFKSEKFVIHDTKRKIAGIYNGFEWILSYAGDCEIYLSEKERSFEKLWKMYYDTVNIKERPHEKQMKGYMPVRYWKFLPEKKEN